jgi:hypothetical protein
MKDMHGSDSEADETEEVSAESFNDLKRQTHAQARQITSLMDLVS